MFPNSMVQGVRRALEGTPAYRSPGRRRASRSHVDAAMSGGRPSGGLSDDGEPQRHWSQPEEPSDAAVPEHPEEVRGVPVW